jgi:dCMP deaminase
LLVVVEGGIMIIGVTGSNGSGKDEVAKVLESMNFKHFSLSDMIREEIRSRGEEVTRDNLIRVGNEMRERGGAHVLAKRALKKVEDGENFAFSSIRNPSEVDLFNKRDDFILIKVTTPIKVRFERIVARGKLGDPTTIEELKEKENLERSSNPNSQQIDKVARMASVTIVNNKSLDVLRSKVERFVSDYIYKLQDNRPDWDHYFMGIADMVKLRASCMSAKKGAIVVKDKKIISTGYNGTAKGIEHCTSGGCERCTLRHLGKIKSGIYSAPCTCAHSEENAIVQAAHNGTSTKGAKMYTTFTPCNGCARMIINAGIVEVIAKVRYPDDVGTKMLKRAGVRLRVLD